MMLHETNARNTYVLENINARNTYVLENINARNTYVLGISSFVCEVLVRWL